MITILCIIVFIWLLKKAFTPEKRDEKKVVEEIEKLPRIELKSNGVSKIDKYWYGEQNILDTFIYDNRKISLKLKSGKSFSAYLSDINVQFEQSKGMPLHIMVYKGSALYTNTYISFYESEHFNNKQWEIIKGVLCLSKKVYGLSSIKIYTKV